MSFFKPHIPILDRTRTCPICIYKVCTSYRIWETLKDHKKMLNCDFSFLSHPLFFIRICPSRTARLWVAAATRAVPKLSISFRTHFLSSRDGLPLHGLVQRDLVEVLLFGDVDAARPLFANTKILAPLLKSPFSVSFNTAVMFQGVLLALPCVETLSWWIDSRTEGTCSLQFWYPW